MMHYRIQKILNHIDPQGLSSKFDFNPLSNASQYSSDSTSSQDTNSIFSDDSFEFDHVSSIAKSIFEFRKTLFPPEFFEARERAMALLKENPHIYYINNQWSPKERKEMTQLQFKHFAQTGLLTVEIVNTKLFWFLGITEAMSTFDMSLLAKIVIHYQLFGSCLWKVGTEKHRKLLKDIDNGTHLCSFAMTEVGHGSNVRALETEAVFDPSTREFVIHTPKDSAVKMWIGNTAFYGTLTIVFAQLIVNGERKGVHAFIVPLRDPQNLSRVTPGVIIRDLGVKNGWQGVDNSLIRFNHVRIPIHNLLNQFGTVLDDGTYTSPIQSEAIRFAKTLAALLFGRVLYIVGPTIALQNVLTITIRYACQRKQFGDNTGEYYIWDYPVHRMKLVPALAYTWAFYFTVSKLTKQFANLNDKSLHHFHTLISSVKAYICEYTPVQLAKCGSTCGGHGVHREVRLGEIQADIFPFQIAEGDSTVLYQQTARDLMDRLRVGKSPNPAAIPDIVTSIINEYSDVMSLTNGLEDFQLGMKEVLSTVSKRLELLLMQAFKEMAVQQSNKISSTEVWNCAQETLLNAARAFVELHLLLNFAVSMKHCKKSSVKSKLLHLFNVFSMDILTTHMGFLLSENVFEPKIGKQIAELRYKLACSFDRTEILDIVNGFMVPDFLLRSPIGLSNLDYVTNILDTAGMTRTQDL